MRIIPEKTSIDFVGKRGIALVFSITMIVFSIFSLFFQGLNLGIDFSGGTLVEVGYQKPIELQKVREQLKKAGFQKTVVQHFGTTNDVLIRVAPTATQSSENISNKILETISTTDEVTLRRAEFVGPQVGEELRDDGGLAMIYALALILIYLALRFEYRFSFGAILALVHDVLITIGFFSITQIEFDLTVLAAILAVIGYSLNDTIVVYDRIRENFRKMRTEDTPTVINTSINHTLARTLMTSMTTLIVLLALYFLGGEVINSFSLALIFGVLIGTYSSIYIASSAIIFLKVSQADLILVEKEDADL
jgi:preprotein translocase subunit SecF